MKTLLSFGHGYSARALSRCLADEGGWKIIGTTRDESGEKAIVLSGAEPRIWPGTDLSADIESATHVLVSIAPAIDGDPVVQACSDQLAASEGLEWIGYLSATSVYGDRNGEWVDESSELSPTTQRGRLRVEAERSWRRLADRHGLPLHLFRLAGIYGPERGPLHQFLAGKKNRVVKSDQYFNRIHVEDIAHILRASMRSPRPGEVYNVCDDCPARSEDVMNFIAGLTGRPPVEALAADMAGLSDMAKSFHAESKRVQNSKVKSQLGISLLHPEFRSGITSLYRQLSGGEGRRRT